MTGRYAAIPTAALLFSMLFVLASASRSQSDPNYRPRLTGVIVEGQQKYKESTIIFASGLVVDKPTSLQDIADAANRLATLGIFKKVRYQYSNTPDEISVLFHVDEETNLLPCVLDNFVWFSDEELIADLREHVAFFDMVLPPAGDVIGQVRAELARFLAAKKFPRKSITLATRRESGCPSRNISSWPRASISPFARFISPERRINSSAR